MKHINQKYRMRYSLLILHGEFAGVVAQAVVEPSRDIESLRERMGESTR